MRITVRVVQRDGVARHLRQLTTSGVTYWAITGNPERAMIFPCASFAQAAIDGFMVGEDPSDYYCDIQDDDDPERGALEPVWTGPDAPIVREALTKRETAALWVALVGLACGVRLTP